MISFAVIFSYYIILRHKCQHKGENLNTKKENFKLEILLL